VKTGKRYYHRIEVEVRVGSSDTISGCEPLASIIFGVVLVDRDVKLVDKYADRIALSDATLDWQNNTSNNEA